MKFEKFLNWIQKQLLFYPDIHLATVKMFVNKFIQCLSDKEKEKYIIELNMIDKFTNKQITIDKLVLKNNIKLFDKELDDIKEN